MAAGFAEELVMCNELIVTNVRDILSKRRFELSHRLFDRRQ